MLRYRFLLAVIAILLLAAPCAVVLGAEEVSFARDVRPLLAAKCFACHGPDEEARQAELRLDQRESAIAMAIVPGDPNDSELLRRVLSDDPTERMPPGDAGPPLTPAQVDILRQWIEAGAKFEPHWAFVPPERPAVPVTRFDSLVRNEIDSFVFAKLEREGLTPSPEADSYTLVRRVYLDLIGLPPTPEEADAFVADSDAQAYEQLVDDLLASPQYGERWARDWLDLARYADTNGYEKDRPRSIWPHRDWVIRALNADMPFDQFSIEQLAGDMLPDATIDQQVATGFHRHTMLNEEGGIDPLEFRFYAMVDRVAATGTVWLGLTTGCAQCHTHKYDPITHTDYYRLMALLNNADEPDLAVPDPGLLAEQRRVDAQIAQLEAEMPDRFPLMPHEAGDSDLPVGEDLSAGSESSEETPASAPPPPLPEEATCMPSDTRVVSEAEKDRMRQRHYERKFEEWLVEARPEAVAWTVLRPDRLRSNLPRLELLADGSVFSTGDVTKRDVYTLTVPLDESLIPITALRLEVLPDDRLPANGPGRTYYEGRKGDFFLSELSAHLNGAPVELTAASHSYGKISIGSGSADAGNVIDGDASTGWSTSGREGQPGQLVVNFADPLTTAGELTIELLFERHFAASLGRFRLSATSAPGLVRAKPWSDELEAILVRERESWSDEEREQVQHQFHRDSPDLNAARTELEELEQQKPRLPETMVMEERPDDNIRPTHRHHRGEYLSPEETVQPGIPEIFATSTSSPPTNRLALARWLVSPQNPLAARVAVNRAWQALFGTGLVRSSDDFGTQSEPPSHPELLDWLAVEFMDRGWSFKELHRLIVTSAVYRQSSHMSADLQERDPENRLLARGPRFRLNAEMIRDSLLKGSGLLSPRMFGPSVYPPQPQSVTALAYGGEEWTPSEGEDRYRRSLYTFSKRTAPFAASTVFDAPTGEVCVARRERSNTPLQSLTLLNDEMYLEMARALAVRAVELDFASVEQRVHSVFRWLLTRPPEPEEISAICTFLDAQRERFVSGELVAAEIVGKEEASAELAAWMMVVRALMNVDEAVTKP